MDSVAIDKNELAIEVNGAYKIFGKNWKCALELLRCGKSKSDVIASTGATVGVDNASFAVRRGEIFVIMGLSGSGKSTLLRLLNRLIEPTAGEIVVEGKSITTMSESELYLFRRESQSMVFQSFALMPHLTVAENVAFSLDIKRRPKRERGDVVEKALVNVGLVQYANSYPRELSGGMQQRVGLARALCVDPSIILMDEAFSALDPINRSQMQDELLKIHRTNSATIVFITHDLHEAMKIADRIAIMEEGRILQIGSPIDIMHHPADQYVERFFDDVNPLRVLRVGDAYIDEMSVSVVRTGVISDLEEFLRKEREEEAVFVDASGLFLGMLSYEGIKSALEGSEEPFLKLKEMTNKERFTLSSDEFLQSALVKFNGNRTSLPVVEGGGRYLGMLTEKSFLKTISIDGK